MSEILLVAVPGGTFEPPPHPPDPALPRRALLRVLVVPRLSVGGPVADSVMAAWPGQLRDLHFEVHLRRNGAAPIRTVQADRRDIARPEVWEAFFGHDTGRVVVPYQSTTYGEPRIDPTSEHADTISTSYERSAKAMAGSAGAGSAAARAAARQTIEAWRDGPAPLPPAPPASPAEETVDFHRFVAALREHPAVLRALGLIVELTAPVSALDSTDSGGPAQVSVGCPGLAIATSAWTAYEAGGRRFLPASAGDIRGGLVDLTGATRAAPEPEVAAADWSIVTVDVDGAVARLRSAAATLAKEPEHPLAPAVRPTDAPDALQLPALRSAGVMLVRRDRLSVINRRRAAAATNAAGPIDEASPFDAEALVLGYRIDVKPDGAPWHPLCSRLAAYTIGATAITDSSFAEEGHVKPHALLSDAGGVNLRGDEVVARWTGWSLVVQPPPLDRASRRRQHARGAMTPPDFHWDFAVPTGSLPSLRFSRRYQLRARVADAAGGGLTIDEPVADTSASSPFAYTRYEPVGPPVLSGAASPAIGGAPMLLVIRSDPAHDPPLDIPGLSALDPRYPTGDQRTMSSPSIAFTVAEHHGVLDGTDAETFAAVRRALGERESPLPDPASGGVVAHARAEAGGLTRPLQDDRAWQGSWPHGVEKVLALVVAPPGADRISLAWVTDNRLEVRLAPAAQVTVELSSSMTSGLVGHFEARRWLEALSSTAVSGGRHPLATPPAIVAMVHAVRRPLAAPKGTLAPAPPDEAATFRLLGTAGLDVHRASTAQVDITATWQEWHDDPQAGPPVRRDVTDAVAGSLSVPIDGALASLRHELGDTRHRTVAYKATAVSRFRRYFAGDEPDDAFRSAGVLAPIALLNSARPPAPSPAAITPAFLWERPDAPPGWTQLVRRRRGGRLRVELRRPWFTSGDGEQLAVLVVTEPTSIAASQLEPFVTRIGRDPIWETPAPDRYVIASGLGTATAAARAIALPEAGGRKAIVVPHDVWLAGDRWYADLDLTTAAASSYSPLVRLALARYQAHSSPGLELSSVVSTPFVPVLPDRMLTVTRADGQVVVLLEGVGPQGPRTNRVDVLLERFVGPTGVHFSAVELSATDEPTDRTPAWVRMPGHSVHGAFGAPLPPLTLPAADSPQRLYIREVEVFASDTTIIADASVAGELGERVVFTDLIAL